MSHPGPAPRCTTPKNTTAAGQYNKSDVEAEWRRIGFHRALGGFWYNYTLVLGSAVFAVLFMFWIMPNYILPFPDAMGFQNLVGNLFAVYFMLADVGVGRAIQRFVADENIKNPQRALAYLQFFNWFQMFTGLVQTSVISVWAIYFVPNTNLAYAAWFIAIYSTIQWPGMLGSFHGALSAFQRFHKANLISFLQGVLLENSTRVACILIGRWIGKNNPAIGEIVGATIGSIIGAYIDDFVAAAIAAWWTAPLLKEVNPAWRLRDMFGTGFDKKLVRDSLWYGIKAILPSTFHQANQFFQTFLVLSFLPNYGTILGLFGLAETVSGIVGTFKFNMVATVAEAYNNGKVELVRNYFTRSYRWVGISQGFLVVIIFLAAPLLGLIAGSEFMLAAPMIQVMVIGRTAETTGSVNADFFMGCDKPEYYIYTNGAEAIARATMLYLGLAFWQVGWLALALGRIAGWWARHVLGLVLVRRLFPYTINIWQTIVAPAGAAAVEYAVLWAFVQYGFPLLTSAIGLIPSAAIVVLLSIFMFPFFIYFPVYAFLGGWDVDSLKIFQKTAKISGPSKPFVMIIYKVAKSISLYTPLHGRFPIDDTKANVDIESLIAMQRQGLASIQAARPAQEG